MAQKAINQKLLWEVMFWVPYRYSGDSPEKRKERPIRGYQEHDGKRASKLIKTIRMAWHYQLRAYHGKQRTQPDFESMKELVVNSLQMEYGWDEKTRNYLSSVASTYITWDSRGQSEVTESELKRLIHYALMFYDPNGNMKGYLHATNHCDKDTSVEPEARDRASYGTSGQYQMPF